METYNEGLNWVSDHTKAWIDLQNTNSHDKKIGIIMGNYPFKDGRLGNGVGLDTPKSIIKISGGREVNLKDDGKELLLSGANGIISAGYLTLDGNSMQKDVKMIEEIDLEA